MRVEAIYHNDLITCVDLRLVLRELAASYYLD